MELDSGMKETSSRLLKQVLVLLATKWVIVVLSLVTSIVVARAVGPEGKGILALLGAFVAIAVVAAGLGVPAAVPYLYQQKRFTPGELIGVSALAWLVTTGIFAMMLVWQREALVAFFLGDTTQVSYDPMWLWLSFFTLPGMLVSGLMSVLLVVDARNRLFVIWNVGGQILGIALTWLLAIVLKGGILGVLISMLIVANLSIGVAAIWLRSLGLAGRLKASWQAFRQMMRIGLQQYAVSFVASIFKRGDAIVVALFVSMSSLGQYAIVLALYGLLIDIPRTLVYPMMGRLADSATTNPAEQAARSIRLQMIVMVGLMAAAAVGGPVLIVIGYGEAFTPAIVPFLVMLPGALFRTIHLGVSAYFLGVGKPGAMTLPLIIGSTFNLGFDVIFVPLAGIIGASMAAVVAEVSMALVSTIIFVRMSHVRWADVVIPRRSDFYYASRVAWGLIRQIVSRVLTRSKSLKPRLS